MDPNPNASISTSNAPYRDLPVASSELFSAKAKKGLTFEQIGKKVDKDEVWVAALFYGQAKATDDELRALSKVLGIGEASLIADLGSHWYPNRGIGPIPPTDPVIYRLFEGVLVYGHALKAVIHEKFGDGIMSMIDCKVHVEKKPDPKGDRVLLTFDGKFLPYAKW
ncbi:cyanate lyase C-terminal domain-containing protein [Lactarius indigo]|nr:cyanate lyase C-terminal domain-containing protein [Lactarius indigo]